MERNTRIPRDIRPRRRPRPIRRGQGTTASATASPEAILVVGHAPKDKVADNTPLPAGRIGGNALSHVWAIHRAGGRVAQTRIDGNETREQLARLILDRRWVVLAQPPQVLQQAVLAMVDLVAAAGGRVYLNLSTDQLADRERALELCRRVWCVQLNREQLLSLVDIGSDVPAAITRLRSLGVRGVIVTDGDHGIVGHVDGVPFYYPAYRVDLVKRGDLGAVFGGTLVASLASGRAVAESATLASAAAAMLAGGIARQGGWAELVRFAVTAPTRPFRQRRARRALSPRPRRALPRLGPALALFASPASRWAFLVAGLPLGWALWTVLQHVW